MPRIHQRFGRYIVASSAAKMPHKVLAPYRHVAVLKMEQPNQTPSMISSRAHGVMRVIRRWERCNVGRAISSAYAVALEEASALAERRFRAGRL